MSWLREKNTIEIDIDGAWQWSDSFPEDHFANGIPVSSIEFTPGAADDICIFKDGAGAGKPMCFYCKSENLYDQAVLYYFGAIKELVLDYSGGTYTAGAKAIINLWPNW